LQAGRGCFDFDVDIFTISFASPNASSRVDLTSPIQKVKKAFSVAMPMNTPFMKKARVNPNLIMGFIFASRRKCDLFDARLIDHSIL
jgi:hypothetical protein